MLAAGLSPVGVGPAVHVLADGGKALTDGGRWRLPSRWATSQQNGRHARNERKRDKSETAQKTKQERARVGNRDRRWTQYAIDCGAIRFQFGKRTQTSHYHLILFVRYLVCWQGLLGAGAAGTAGCCLCPMFERTQQTFSSLPLVSVEFGQTTSESRG